MLKFYEEGHQYKSDDNTNWLSVTSLVHKYTPPFEPLAAAEKASNNKRSKWYGLSVEEILQAWDEERDRSTVLGTWYHKKREELLYSNNELTVYIPQVTDGVKIASDQKLIDGVLYPEHIVYLPSAGICGQVDYLEVTDNTIIIRDYKTSKEIKRKGFVAWDGTIARMKAPLHHLEECEFNHYALQLSIYMYIITRHNPALTPGKLIIEHVSFEQEGVNKYGYPIYKLDENGEPVIKGIEIIEVPYLKKEVVSLVEQLKKDKK